MKKTYKVKVKALSPIHINAGVDAGGMRLTIKLDDTAYIPATLMKGIMRHNFESLISENSCLGKDDSSRDCCCAACTMFGKAGYKPSKIILDNLLPITDPLLEIRANNAVDRYLKSVKDGALVVSEVVSPFDKSGNNIVFAGDMTIYYGYEKEYQYYEDYILKAVRMIRSIGSGVSRGLGFVETEVECDD